MAGRQRMLAKTHLEPSHDPNYHESLSRRSARRMAGPL